MIRYISTRGGGQPRSFEQVLLSGLAPDGGLYVPESWPQLDLSSLRGKSYQEIAEAAMFPFVEGSIERADFRAMINETYCAENFRHGEVAPLHKLKDNLYVLELFHGPTLAFKDVALQLLGRLFDHVLKRSGEHVTIVGATSGDTGSAAIEGCRHSDQLDIFILHPKGRVSDVQRRQMTTVDAPNVQNIAIEGSFDDCQNLVKAMFNDAQFREDLNLSAVNSINWARIMAQIVYYVSSALVLGAPDEEITFVVPTGNFGNVYAGYCAQQIGLPIKLVVATNENDILTRFFESGEMKKAGVKPTISPSMDIEVSSNFERYLFDLLGRDAATLTTLMDDFKKTGVFAAPLAKDFTAFRTDETQTLDTIRSIHDETGYTLDPHTAVGMHAALEIAGLAKGPVVVLATAHPAKFPEAVERAIGIRPPLPPHLSDLLEKKEQMRTLPNDLKTVQNFVREYSKIKKESANV